MQTKVVSIIGKIARGIWKEIKEVGDMFLYCCFIISSLMLVIYYICDLFVGTGTNPLYIIYWVTSSAIIVIKYAIKLIVLKVTNRKLLEGGVQNEVSM